MLSLPVSNLKPLTFIVAVHLVLLATHLILSIENLARFIHGHCRRHWTRNLTEQVHAVGAVGDFAIVVGHKGPDTASAYAGGPDVICERPLGLR